ncbi:MAG: hypothetical protein JW772_01525 [Candidatus Diapherotrites archaeon]|nr:hypothetical protein [Candidatus Diapherotrites archaeon]
MPKPRKRTIQEIRKGLKDQSRFLLQQRRIHLFERIRFWSPPIDPKLSLTQKTAIIRRTNPDLADELEVLAEMLNKKK